jgi:hypothetical protein
MAARTIRIAVIGGDGIGPEAVGEAIKVRRAAATDVTIETTSYDLGDLWRRTLDYLAAEYPGVTAEYCRAGPRQRAGSGWQAEGRPHRRDHVGGDAL